MLQASEDSELEGFIAGPFNKRILLHYFKAKLRVALLKDRMLLGLDVLFDQNIRLNSNSGVKELSTEIVRQVCQNTTLTFIIDMTRKLGEFRLNLNLDLVTRADLATRTFSNWP